MGFEHHHRADGPGQRDHRRGGPEKPTQRGDPPPAPTAPAGSTFRSLRAPSHRSPGNRSREPSQWVRRDSPNQGEVSGQRAWLRAATHQARPPSMRSRPVRRSPSDPRDGAAQRRRRGWRRDPLGESTAVPAPDSRNLRGMQRRLRHDQGRPRANRLLWLRILERLHGRSTVREDLCAPSTPVEPD